MSPAAPWWRPDRHADRAPLLAARGRITAAVRGWFAGQGFAEAEIAPLVVSPGAEVHLQAFKIEGAALYLHTSPEFACKRLLAAGERKIMSLGFAFRAGERGPLHAPAFTMLEWYRAGAEMAAAMADCTGLLRAAAQAAGTTALHWRDLTCDPFMEPETITVREALLRHAGFDIADTMGPDGAPDRAALAAAAAGCGVRVADGDDWGDLFSRVLVARVEPQLGLGRASFLSEYPIAEAALARPCPHDPRFAERFELYACGVELANGFGELTDPDEQRSRLEAAMAAKALAYGQAWPIDEDFLAAVAAMPEAAGVALGFDRLCVLATAAPDIAAVMWTPPA